MQARLIGADAPEWAELRQMADHDVYDSPAYASLCAWHEQGEAAALFVDDGARRQLLVPLVIRDVDGRLRDATSPYGYPGILTNQAEDAPFVREAMLAGIEALRDANIVSLFVRLHPLLLVDGLDGLGAIMHHQTVAIDLALPDERIWAETRENHRRDITKAIREGYEFSFDGSPEAIAAFRRIYLATMERLEAADYYRFDDEYFDRMFATMGDEVHLALVRSGDEVAAAGLFIECCGIVQLHLSGADERFAARRPTKLLYHGVCKWAKQRGDRWFHLGGGRGSAEDSLFHFKAGFSTYRGDFRTLRMIVREEDYRALVAARGLAADVTDLSGYFPAYRQVIPLVP